MFCRFPGLQTYLQSPFLFPLSDPARVYFKRLSEMRHSSTQFPPTILSPWKLSPRKLSPFPFSMTCHPRPSSPLACLLFTYAQYWTPPEHQRASPVLVVTHLPNHLEQHLALSWLSMNDRRNQPTVRLGVCTYQGGRDILLSRDWTAVETCSIGRGGAHSPMGLGTALHCSQATKMSSGKGLSTPQRSRSHKEADRKRKKS